MTPHIPTTIDAILDEEYERRRISRDSDTRAARNAVEKISARPAKETRSSRRVG